MWHVTSFRESWEAEKAGEALASPSCDSTRSPSSNEAGEVLASPSCASTRSPSSDQAGELLDPPSYASARSPSSNDDESWSNTEEWMRPAMLMGEERLEFYRRTCHDPDFDLNLVARLIELMGIRGCFSLTDALAKRFDATSEEAEDSVRQMLKCVRFLHLCRYTNEDIEVVVAHASVYLQEVQSDMERKQEPGMEMHQLGMVFCLLMYIAHTWVLDQTCSLSVWHKHLFAKFCSMKILNSATWRLLKRRDFVLRVEPEQLDKRLVFLSSTGAQSPKDSKRHMQLMSPHSRHCHQHGDEISILIRDSGPLE
eukprot:gnl/TRDRNA2_/TRDRNA2_84398_c0_seq1.p1 gnl/TRDRNA2_/TRDRNA2_84398_c0~~gnl/TRDRNA2_/TRDRNA2_84398_c0_seq1.p1  ORF type:complete len:311 (-),score=51.11 gnl/TRDRNA2_/TRDRNA2_84398_c0_seq1:58-990(-)